MKKLCMGILLIIFIIVIIVALHSTNKKAAQTIQNSSMDENAAETDIVITDNFFIQATNDVYLNVDGYVGQTIRMEGFIYEYKDRSGDSHVAVVRNSPGCCGNDGLAGLDIAYADYPSHGTWVEVVGTIKKIRIDGQPTPIIDVTSLEEKPEGMTFVTN